MRYKGRNQHVNSNKISIVMTKNVTIGLHFPKSKKKSYGSSEMSSPQNRSDTYWNAQLLKSLHIWNGIVPYAQTLKITSILILQILWPLPSRPFLPSLIYPLTICNSEQNSECLIKRREHCNIFWNIHKFLPFLSKHSLRPASGHIKVLNTLTHFDMLDSILWC